MLPPSASSSFPVLNLKRFLTKACRRHELKAAVLLPLPLQQLAPSAASSDRKSPRSQFANFEASFL